MVKSGSLESLSMKNMVSDGIVIKCGYLSNLQKIPCKIENNNLIPSQNLSGSYSV